MNDVYLIEPINLRKYIEDNLLITAEAIEILGVSRARMHYLVKEGKLQPIKKSAAVNLFWKDDVLRKKVELEKMRKVYGPFG